MRERFKDLRSWLKSISWRLFATVVLWTIVATAAFTLLGYLWSPDSERGFVTIWQNRPDFELLKVALTTIGGIGAVGYLVIKYRERASAEREEKGAQRREADARLLAGVEQLGSESPQVRIAGVYALADVADTYLGEYKQRVVDILCGYLRTERGEWTKASPNSSEETKEREATNSSEETKELTNGNKKQNTSRQQKYVSQDGAVESTVLSVLARHLRKARPETDNPGKVIQEVDDEQLWCDCTIDLHDAVFIELVDFSETTFNKVSDFSSTHFCESAKFVGSTFNEMVDYSRSSFNRSAEFYASHFAKFCNYSGAQFYSTAVFASAHFINAGIFENAEFNGEACFMNAQFNFIASFKETQFSENIYYPNIPIGMRHNFSGAIFNEALKREGAVQIPDEIMKEDTGLPEGARWVRFDDDGNPVEDEPSDQE